MTALGNFGLDIQNDKDDIFVGFSQRNNSKIINTFFDCKANKKWTWKNPNCELKMKLI